MVYPAAGSNLGSLNGAARTIMAQAMRAIFLGKRNSGDLERPALYNMRKPEPPRAVLPQKIEILNVEGLEETACECYGTVNPHYPALLGPPHK